MGRMSSKSFRNTQTSLMNSETEGKIKGTSAHVEVKLPKGGGGEFIFNADFVGSLCSLFMTKLMIMHQNGYGECAVLVFFHSTENCLEGGQSPGSYTRPR